jgi:hypothetical protein
LLILVHFSVFFLGALWGVKAGIAKKHDRVLNLLAAEPGQRFHVLREHPDNAAVRAIEKWLILIGKRGGRRLLVAHEHGVSLVSVRRPVLVIVYGFPEADPDVENSQSTTEATEESASYCRTQVGETLEKIVVGPFRTPGQQDQ